MRRYTSAVGHRSPSGDGPRSRRVLAPDERLATRRQSTGRMPPLMGKMFIAAAAATSKGSSSSTFLILIVVIIGVFYFLMIRPQRNRQRQAQQMQSAATPGQRVRTTAGMYATVVGVDGDDVILEVAPGVEVRYMRAAIRDVLSDDDAYSETPEESGTGEPDADDADADDADADAAEPEDVTADADAAEPEGGLPRSEDVTSEPDGISGHGENVTPEPGGPKNLGSGQGRTRPS